jgi:nicotinamidase-related amidase
MSVAHEKYVDYQNKRNSASVSADLRTTALLIIDMQEYFFNPESPFNRFEEAQTPGVGEYFYERVKTVAIPNLRRLLEFFRVRNALVMYTTIASESQDGLDLPPSLRAMNERARAQVGEAWIPARADPWARIVDSLSPNPNEIVINKTTYSCFASTGLDGILRNMGVETLVIGGVVTHRCVETTTRDATDIGYQVIMVDDGTATYSPEVQQATMLSLKGAYAYVRSTDESLAQFGGHGLAGSQ